MFENDNYMCLKNSMYSDLLAKGGGINGNGSVILYLVPVLGLHTKPYSGDPLIMENPAHQLLTSSRMLIPMWS